jgi:ferredoxin
MGTGPKVASGFDLALTELTGPTGDGGHRFVVEIGSERGADVMESVPHRDLQGADAEAAEGLYRRAAERMGRTMETTDVRELLYQNYESPRWDDVARRCLTCGNCTLACPTCFCSTMEDATDLAGENAERRRRWDSCFSVDFTFIHGGAVRPAARSRYRHWITHKLATWLDQYGTSGCVGCGRCITWCPVGIDITEEVGAIIESEREHGDT